MLAPLTGIGSVTVSPHDRPLTPAEPRAAVAGADAVITTLNDRIGPAVLDTAGPRLRVVANTATGHDNLDVAAITARGAVATNTPGVLVDATADLTTALLLDVHPTSAPPPPRPGPGWPRSRWRTSSPS